MAAFLAFLECLTEVQRELIKLVFQFAGAMVIAWLTVRLALNRFKSEKLWERETAALTDIFSAIRELEEVNYLRLQENDEQGVYSEPYLKILAIREVNARDRLVSVSGIARLVLQDPIRSVLEEMEPDILERFDNDEPWIDYLERRAKVLNDARNNLLSAARRYLRS